MKLDHIIIELTGDCSIDLSDAKIVLISSCISSHWSVNGEIPIAAIDINNITLHHLRSRLSVLPQLPIRFFETYHHSLDPFE